MTQEQQLPICVMAPEESGRLIAVAARRFDGLQIIVG
jgi:hypothetical protein